MMIFLVPLASIRPLAGCFGRFQVFSAALGTAAQPFGLLWLVILALAFSAVSLYDYLQVLKRIYVFEAPPLALSTRILEVSQVPLAVMALVVLVLGAAPEWLIAKLGAAINLAGP